jgi:hypothetical protein
VDPRTPQGPLTSNYGFFTAQTPVQNYPSGGYPVFTLQLERNHVYTFMCAKSNMATVDTGSVGNDIFYLEAVDDNSDNVTLIHWATVAQVGTGEIPIIPRGESSDSLVFTAGFGFSYPPEVWGIHCSYSESPMLGTG